MGKKILFINQETTPYVPKSEMANFGCDMPNYMQESGFEIRTFMPKWSVINERRGQLHEVIRLSGMNLIIDDTDHPLIIKVASIPQTRIQVYFIDNEDYFQRRTTMTKDEDGNDYADNGERAIFFARGVLETVKKLRWSPDIIHCQGWMSSVVPFYVKTAYKNEPQFANSKIITSLFSDQPSTPFGCHFKKCLEFKGAKASMLKTYSDDFDFTDLGKLAIDYSDGVVQTSGAVEQSLIDYANENKKELLLHPSEGEEIKANYTAFYNKIIG
ncbi:MAG: glycogen/starch synthase [Prevotella sp.]|nr:glycogen/starch synthase [Prevotella sp.]MDD7273684.1 glycogen/starch synthase [Prevotellaceae bacterium]MDY3935441.1 glycogen/starch synthase [Prevotella sp.]MDY4217725.1 glycogen/starch synthase [Prevotella sp.]